MKLGSRFKRFIASIIDRLILSSMYMVLYIMNMAYFVSQPNSLLKVWVNITAVPLTMIYFIMFEQSKYQATPGKMLLKLYVADMSGKKISLSRAFKRYIWQFTPFLFCLILSFILLIITLLLPSSYGEAVAPVFVIFILIAFVVMDFMLYLPILFKPRLGVYEELSGTVVLSR